MFDDPNKELKQLEEKLLAEETDQADWFEKELQGAVLVDGVITDGNITTAYGAGVAVDFALELARVFVSDQVSADIRRAIQCR